MMSKRNRYSQKGPEKEERAGVSKQAPGEYQKLRNSPHRGTEGRVSTGNNPANGKYSRTHKRDDELNNADTRGGR